MRLDITAHNPSQRPNQIIDLSRVRTSDRVCDTDPVHPDLIDGTVDGEEVDEFGTEGVFGREADLDTLGLDELDDFDSAVDVSGASRTLLME